MSHHSPSEDKEMLSRLRRIETRLTRYLTEQGFETGVEKPVFADGKLRLPSPNCSLKDCLAAIPETWDNTVDLYVGEDYITTIG